MRVFHHRIIQDGGRDPLQQRAQDLPDRVDKAEGGLVTAHLARLKWVGTPHPLEPVERRPMQSLHALRTAGGTRSIDHIGQWVGDVKRDWVLHRLPGNCLLIDVQAYPPGYRQVQALSQRAAGDQHRRLRIGQHKSQARFRVGRVQRQERRPGFQDTQQPHHHLRGAFQAQADRRLGRHSQ